MITRRVLASSSSMPVVALLLLATLLSAQTRKLSPKQLPPSAFRLVSIKVIGAKHYTQNQIIAATGLELGQIAHEDDFKKAAQTLGETGAFTDVVFSFQYSPQGTRLEFQVTENDRLVPARFDNFVWFTDQQLMDQLRTRVPLFQGELPVSGKVADQVSDALQALLIEKNIPGRADYLRAAPENGPIEAFIFNVSGATIHIRHVGFAGAAAGELPLLEPLARKLEGADYLRSIMRVQAEMNFLPVYLERGYLKAAFGDAQARVAQDSPQETLVDVTFPVNPGLQYKVTEMQLSGNQAFPAGQLRELIHQKMDQPANAVQLDGDVEAMKKLYGTRGYMTASIQATPEMNDAQSTVKYMLLFKEGDAYKMGDLDIVGLDSRSTARLVENWKLRGGDAYDSSYLQQFVDESLKELQLMGDWKVALHQSLNQTEKTVDVTIRFDPK